MDGCTGAFPRRHFRSAVLTNKFEDILLTKEAGYLRDRLGLKLSFLENPLLCGMLAAKQTKEHGQPYKVS